MKVKCLYNHKSNVPLDIQDKYPYSWDHLSLEIGKEYVVYSIAEIKGYTWYCICDEDYTYYPRYRQFPLFEISDSKMSRFWEFNLFKDDLGYVRQEISFPEWIQEEYFYSNLVDCEERERSIFNRYKELMDLEFPDPSISVIAEVGDESWLICPNCIDAWECQNNIDALVKCPKCGKKMNNPRYTNR